MAYNVHDDETMNEMRACWREWRGIELVDRRLRAGCCAWLEQFTPYCPTRLRGSATIGLLELRLECPFVPQAHKPWMWGEADSPYRRDMALHPPVPNAECITCGGACGSRSRMVWLKHHTDEQEARADMLREAANICEEGLREYDAEHGPSYGDHVLADLQAEEEIIRLRDEAIPAPLQFIPRAESQVEPLVIPCVDGWVPLLPAYASNNPYTTDYLTSLLAPVSPLGWVPTSPSFSSPLDLSETVQWWEMPVSAEPNLAPLPIVEAFTMDAMQDIEVASPEATDGE